MGFPFETCCGCVELPLGSLLIAIYNFIWIVSNMWYSYVVFYMAHKVGEKDKGLSGVSLLADWDPGDLDWSQFDLNVLATSILITQIIFLVINILLIIGIKKENALFVLIYIITFGIILIIKIVLDCFDRIIIFTGVSYVLDIYFTLVIYSFYKSLAG